MNKLRKAWNIVSTVIVALVIICALFLMGTRLLGYQVYNVISGSMEPEYSVGDLIYVKEIDIDKITKVLGMEITFTTSTEKDEEALALQREFGLPFKK